MPRNLNNLTQTNGYTVVKPNIPLEWSSMYMAQTNQGTADCGKIIPVFWKELMPNQTVNVEQSVAIQFTPFVSNLFHQLRGELMSFFVPYRICAFIRASENIDEDKEEEADQLKWQGYITGGKSGQDDQKLPQVSLNYFYNRSELGLNTVTKRVGTLFDYFGYPIHNLSAYNSGTDNAVNELPICAYNLIYNTKYRNPDYTAWKPVSIANQSNSTNPDENRKKAAECATAYWNADRFTRARKAQYRGIAPTFPLNNELIELAHKLTSNNPDTGLTSSISISESVDTSDQSKLKTEYVTQNGNVEGSVKVEKHTIQEGELRVSLDYNEFLYNLAVLKYETNNARIKPLYVEQLKYRFGIIPQDSRFQEPEWIASNSFNIGIDINEAHAGTTQLSESEGSTIYTQNNQGKITSQAWGGGQGLKSEYKALEHGIFMTLMIIRPEGVYEGGLDRHLWGDRTRLSFPTPELMNTPDQEIWTGELYFRGVKENDKAGFGWEQIYDQDRTMTNQVCGLLRPSINNGLKTYTLARYWNSENIPVLNDNFLLCKPDMTRIKQYTSQPDFIFFTRTEIKTALPMPIINEPIDIGM